MRLLFVEDDQRLAQTLSHQLKKQYAVDVCESITKAELAIEASAYDAIILDISLPEMDGTEILRRIREDPGLQDLPVIALTAHALVGDREKYLSAGFNDYVAKPILDMGVLFSTIQRWIPG